MKLVRKGGDLCKGLSKWSGLGVLIAERNSEFRGASSAENALVGRLVSLSFDSLSLRAPTGLKLR